MADIRNEFSWSFTRHKCFRECLRQYYYNYYGYWGGWSPNAPDEARLAYRLKKMASLPMWLGDVVHRMCERILGDLQNREASDVERYQKQARDIMNREWKQSLDRGWRWKPKYNLNLFEHYYGVEIAQQERAAAREKVFRCLTHFMESPVFDDLARLKPEGWKSIEQLDQFTVGDHGVFVKIDCAVVADGQAVLYDWKTGKETGDTLAQLGCYALYAFQQWRTPLEQQKLVSFYLDEGKVQEHVPSPEEVVDTKDLILRSMQEMTERLSSSAKENVAEIDNFPMTEQTYRCQRCFFRELCYDSREWPPPGQEEAF